MTTTEPIAYRLTPLGLRELAAYANTGAPTAEDRLAAVLAIHVPCHDQHTEPWGCIHGHCDDDCTTGIPADYPTTECLACSYDNRRITYPCPTAIAAGAQPEGAPA